MSFDTTNVVPFTRSAAYMHQRALKNRRENNLLDALELIRRALEKEPDNADYQMDHAEILCEMGCFIESNRVLLKVLAGPEAPNECYFGLCCNFYGMNDLESAYRALTYFLNGDPEATERGEVSDMLENLVLARELNVKTGRKKIRAAHFAQNGCARMREGDLNGGVELLRRSIELNPKEEEVRSLYALCLSIQEKNDEAIGEITKLTEAAHPRVKTLCIAARIFARAGDMDGAHGFTRRARRTDPEYDELRLVIQSACEFGMHDLALELTRKALAESPYDRTMLHYNAIAHLNQNANAEAARHNWERIRRIDPDDTIAPCYLTLLEKELLNLPAAYVYQVPDEERLERVKYLSGIVSGGKDVLSKSWAESTFFHQMLEWALLSDEPYLSKVGLNILAMLDGMDAENLMRAFLLRTEANDKLRQMATILLSMKDARQPYLTMTEKGLAFVNVSDAQEPGHLPYPHRRVLKLAIKYARPLYGDDLTEPMTRRWMALVNQRGDLLRVKNPDTWAAGLVLSCARADARHGESAWRVPGLFRTTPRAAERCARLIDEAGGKDDGE